MAHAQAVYTKKEKKSGRGQIHLTCQHSSNFSGLQKSTKKHVCQSFYSWLIQLNWKTNKCIVKQDLPAV